MKVLNVNSLIDPLRGAGTAERTVQMSRFLVSAGMDCTVLTMDLGITAELLRRLSGVTVLRLPCLWPRFFVPGGEFRQLLYAVKWADIIHLMSHWTWLNAVVYLLSRRLNKPYVVCPAGALPYHYRSQTLKTIYNRIVGNRIVREASRCIAVTQDEIAIFRTYGIPSEGVTTIPNGIDPDLFTNTDGTAFRRRFGLEGKKLILFVGRLSQIKGPDLLVRAFANLKDEFPQYDLVLAGRDEGLLESLFKIAAQHGMSNRIHFVGFLTGEQKSQLYHAADLLVIPSRHEAMSIVVLEGGIAGCPVLVTDRCGVNFVKDVGGGEVVPASREGVQHGLMTLLANPQHLPTMGQNLRKYVIKRFAWDTIVEEYVRLYRGILEGAAVQPH